MTNQKWKNEKQKKKKSMDLSEKSGNNGIFQQLLQSHKKRRLEIYLWDNRREAKNLGFIDGKNFEDVDDIKSCILK